MKQHPPPTPTRTARSRDLRPARRRLTVVVAGALAGSLLATGTGIAATAPTAAAGTTLAVLTGPPAPTATNATNAAASPALPELTVTTLVSGLTNPWDVAFTPDGTLVYDVRDGGLGAVLPGGEVRTMTADFSDNFVGNESGAMGIAVDPDYAQNRNIYVCQTLRGPDAGRPGVGSRNAVVKWRIAADYRSAARVGTIVDGLQPAPLATDPQASQGRHVGCRLRFDGAGLLYISVGDGRTPTGPEDITSPMGKVLRVTTAGRPAPGNPFLSNPDATAKMVFSYGHRNPQGLALQPGTGWMWEDEHGPDADDEINLLSAGSDYGWNPVGPGGEYQDNGTPMTRPGAVPAAWSSGNPTIATSGSTFLSGSQWGAWDGALAVATLKGVSLRLFSVSAGGTPLSAQSARPAETGQAAPAGAVPGGPEGAVVSQIASTTIDGAGSAPTSGTIGAATPQAAAANPVGVEFDGTFGRLRTAQLGPDGALYLTTSNGGGADKILRVAASPYCTAPADDPTPSGVAAARTSSGTTAFVRGADDAVWFRTTDPGAGWATLDGRILYGPAAVSWGGDRLDLFVIGTDGGLYHKAGAAGGPFTGWENLGGRLTASPAVLSFAPDRLNIYGRGTDGQLWTMAWTGTAWTSWSPLGGALTSAPGAVADRVSGQGTVGVRGTDGRLYEFRFDAQGPARLTMVGTPLCSAPAYSAPDGTPGSTALAFRTGDFALSIGGTTVGGVLTSAPALVADRAGPGVTAFGRGLDNALWAYTGPPGSGGWSSLGGVLN